jgi:hypothetical protein
LLISYFFLIANNYRHLKRQNQNESLTVILRLYSLKIQLFKKIFRELSNGQCLMRGDNKAVAPIIAKHHSKPSHQG